MSRFITSLMYALMLSAGVMMSLSAADKKDDKKDGKGGSGKPHQPVVVVIYEPAWSPVMREV